MEVQGDFMTLMTELEELQGCSVELAADAFKLVEKRIRRANRKVSTMQHSNNGNVRILTLF